MQGKPAGDQACRMSTTTHASSDYVMDRSDEETERLRTQSRIFAEPTASLLDRVGLGPGMSCLDAGCGGGDVMRLLAERVGHEGRVTGVDVDGALGRMAVDDLRGELGASLEFIEGDVLEVALWPASFDLAFARFLLIHLDQPAAALRRLWEWTRPGGRLAVLDFDFRTLPDQDGLAAIQELYELGAAVFAGAGRDMRFGAKLPNHFERAGIGVPDGTAVSALLVSLDQLAPYLVATFRSLIPAARRLGIETEQRSERFLAALADESRNGRRDVLGPLLVSAWKRKPGSESVR
jgi:SAM-dependent methyltransferase